MIPKLQALRHHLDAVESFCERYAPAFQSMHWSFNTEPDESLTIYFFCAAYSGGKDLLALVGQTFGTVGWTSIRAGRYFKWSRQIGDVTLICMSAAEAPEEQEVPVAPREWPLLLENHQDNSL